MTKKDEIIEYYILSLIDIMAQKNELNKLNDLVLKNDKKEINNILNKTYGKMKSFRKHMQGAITWLNDIKQDNQKSQFNSNSILIDSFSDLAISYVSLRSDINKLQFEGIYFLLFGNGLVFLQMLSEGTPLKGGVDLGIGIRHNGNEIYGSALSNAYHLESAVARSFRIVVGKQLYNYIIDASNEDILSNESLDYNIYWAKECLNLIKIDIDGEYIVDFLSEKFQQLEKFQIHYNKAKQFLQLEKARFMESSNCKLVEKYKVTLDYFQSANISGKIK